MFQRFFIQQPVDVCKRRAFLRLDRLLFILPVLMIHATPAAMGDVAKEYAVKAAFLVNFAEFVDWPNGRDADAVPVTIGVIGDDPFSGALDAIVSSKNAGGRRYVVQHYQRMEEISNCHILFVALHDEGSIRALIKSLAGQPTLTVGEVDSFLRCGGNINFFFDEDRVRFEINQQSAEKAGLKISAKLLRLQKKPDR